MRGLRQVQSVERPAFRVDRRLRRVQILRDLVGVHGSAAEGNDRPGVAADGHHQAVAKPIDAVAVVALGDQPALEQQALGEPLLQQPRLQPVTRRRRVAEPELLDAFSR